ncbi:MAG: VanW family protein [Patescibacteria group bacterium]
MAESADIAVNLISLDLDATSKNIFQYGRGASFFSGLLDILNAAVYGERVFLAVETNDEKIKELLENGFTPLEVQAKSAGLEYANGAFAVTREQSGQLVNYDKALNSLKSNLRRANFSPIEVEISQVASPEVSYSEVLESDAINRAESIIGLAPLTLTCKDKKWPIAKEDLAGFLALKKDYAYCQANPAECENTALSKIKVGIDEDKFREYLEKNVSPQIDIAAQDARFKIENGAVTEFQGSNDGQKLDLEKSLAKIEFELAIKKNNKVELAVEVTKSGLSQESVNEYGIKEIVGIGESNFAGSPTNRRKNIRTGANKLNGVLIRPGEEFSLLKALGKIDGTTGYFTELVIKGNKTIPEYGGGLCQIGTTVFRAALASGLPITARANHSYRVQYYEPAGTDATIYDPAPDLKFLNDTGNYILIQSRIEGNYLYFDFWGAKDGRQITKTKPVIYNIVKPAPQKIVETTDLKPGEKKCTEKAHNGADAYFDYKVIYPSGEAKEKRFSSHYRPWQAVCLLGVEKLSAEANVQTPAVQSTGSSTIQTPAPAVPSSGETPPVPSQ